MNAADKRNLRHRTTPAVLFAQLSFMGVELIDVADLRWFVNSPLRQLDLFADRTSSHTMRANQLRLLFSSFAYLLPSAMRRTALKGTRLAKATCGTIRLKLLKIGAQVKISTRRFLIHLASACPYQDVFHQAWQALTTQPLRC